MAPRRTKRETPEGKAPGRFVATIQPGRHGDLAGLSGMGLDVLPTRDSDVRALVTVGECVALLDAGYEVRLHAHYPVEPVDPALVASEAEARRWLKRRLAEIRPDATQRKPTGRSRR